MYGLIRPSPPKDVLYVYLHTYKYNNILFYFLKKIQVCMNYGKKFAKTDTIM